MALCTVQPVFWLSEKSTTTTISTILPDYDRKLSGTSSTPHTCVLRTKRQLLKIIGPTSNVLLPSFPCNLYLHTTVSVCVLVYQLKLFQTGFRKVYVRLVATRDWNYIQKNDKQILLGVLEKPILVLCSSSNHLHIISFPNKRQKQVNFHAVLYLKIFDRRPQCDHFVRNMQERTIALKSAYYLVVRGVLDKTVLQNTQPRLIWQKNESYLRTEQRFTCFGAYPSPIMPVKHEIANRHATPWARGSSERLYTIDKFAYSTSWRLGNSAHASEICRSRDGRLRVIVLGRFTKPNWSHHALMFLKGYYASYIFPEHHSFSIAAMKMFGISLINVSSSRKYANSSV